MSEAVVHERSIVIRSELGLHARPAGTFVAAAGAFESTISVGRGDEWVDGRSILSLLSLAAGCGTVLRIRAEGVDAEQAVATLGELLERAAVSAEPASGDGSGV